VFPVLIGEGGLQKASATLELFYSSQEKEFELKCHTVYNLHHTPHSYDL